MDSRIEAEIYSQAEKLYSDTTATLAKNDPDTRQAIFSLLWGALLQRNPEACEKFFLETFF